MVNNQEQSLDSIFHALSDPTRRAMLARLAKGQCNVSELPNPYKVSKAAISKHLGVLHDANLVDKQKDGRETKCIATPQTFEQVFQLLEDLGQFWRGRLDSLDQYFKENLSKETKYDKATTKTNSKKSNSR